MIDFFIIGAQKAASTTIQSALGDSPEIHLVDGELGIFEGPNYNQYSTDEYLKRIKSLSKGRMLGAKRPNLLCEPEALGRLMSHCPKARLIVVLRDPVNRAFSALLHLYRYGLIAIRDPNEALLDLLDRYPDLPRLERTVLEYGLYGKALGDIKKRHPSVPVLIIKEASFRQYGDDLSLGVANFLGLTHFSMEKNPSKNVGARTLPRLRYFAFITSLCYKKPDLFGRLHLRYPNALFRIMHRALAAIDSYIFAKFGKSGNVMQLDKETRDRLSSFYKDDKVKLETILSGNSFTVL